MSNVVRLKDGVTYNFPLPKKQSIIKEEEDTFLAAEEAVSKSSKVLPFDNINEVNLVVKELASKSYRDMCLFVLGCNTQLRISDILDFRWKDIFDFHTNQVKDEFVKKEKKTGKIRHIYVNDAVKMAVQIYMKSQTQIIQTDYMFVSHSNHRKTKTKACDGHIVLQSMPMSEQSVSRIIRSATKNVGLWKSNRRFSTHSMRKTGVRAAAGFLDGRNLPDEILKEAASLERVRAMVGHSSTEVTARYIDLPDKFNKTVFLWMNLGIEALSEIKNNFM